MMMTYLFVTKEIFIVKLKKKTSLMTIDLVESRDSGMGNPT